MTKRTVSRAQQTALARFPNATVSSNDFTLARGHAVCHEELVEPLLVLLREARGPLSSEDSYVPERIGAPSNETLVKKIDEVLRILGPQ